jgi:hypothetical protein
MQTHTVLLFFLKLEDFSTISDSQCYKRLDYTFAKNVHSAKSVLTAVSCKITLYSSNSILLVKFTTLFSCELGFNLRLAAA